MIDVGMQIKALLDKQLTHYRAMKQVVERQTGYIEAMDIGGLTASTAETRALMRKIRDIEADLRPLRQGWNNLGLDRPVVIKRQIDAQIEELRELIEGVQAAKDRNKAMLERSMEDVRKQMTGLKLRKHASQAYRGRPAAKPAARFIDRSN